MTSNSEINDKWLSLIQGVVDRMARESASLKTYAVTLLGALAVFTRLSGQPKTVLAAAPAFLMLGLLDAYYLGQERGFRRLYEEAIRGTSRSQGVSEWSLTPLHRAGTSATSGRRSYLPWLRDGLGPTVIVFHGAAIVVLVVLALLPVKKS